MSKSAHLILVQNLMRNNSQGVVSITLVMPQFLDQFPEVSPAASGAGFQKGLMTAMIELGAFIGNYEHTGTCLRS
jgi:hypothetical protein